MSHDDVLMTMLSTVMMMMMVVMMMILKFTKWKRFIGGFLGHEIKMDFSKSTLKLFSIQCYGPRLYSSIPSSIKDLIQLNTCPFNFLYLLFKKSYKQYLLRGIE